MQISISSMMSRFVPMLAVLMILSAPAGAHPHVWIDNVTTLLFADGKIAAVRIRWTFDELFGSGVITDFDKNKDGVFDAEETKQVKAEAFSALSEFNYFTHVFVDGAPLKIETVRDFKPSVAKGGQLVYEFTAVLPKPIDPTTPGLKIGIYDPSFYIYVGPDKNDPVRFAGMKDGACRYKIIEDKDHPIYGGVVFPEVITLQCAAG